MADFVASSIAGAAAIVLGNPIDVIKVRLQSGSSSAPSRAPAFETWTSMFRGAAAPVITNGALNALLFVSFNRSLAILENDNHQPILRPSLHNVWLAGAFSGLVTFIVSTPTEVVKCRAQLYNEPNTTSWTVARDIWRSNGIRGLYHGGVITSLRDSIGYGFYFWAYEASKNILGLESETAKTLVAGGIAGCVTWATIYPLDVVKTRVQTQQLLQVPSHAGPSAYMGALDHARDIYRTEGLRGYFSGFWWCMGRAFFVNAVQWALYEYIMGLFSPAKAGATRREFEAHEQKYNL
ncbi:hypothetical protein Dda_2335 [Drechslerella dactyloides]|uniref:Mitochondrial carrier protein n=1 Tax=Drechslerella dactyloides TaxID=74499 RepID=A0AAD6J567_DREDA|nr:hypothetical protein Dda_2335 [Drechslerella dactyloides]